LSRPGLTDTLRHRDFALLWAGQTVSVAGDGIFTVALALETLRVDDRPSALSFVLAARLVPTVLLLLLGGVVVDRVPRRLAMLASDGARGVAVGVIAYLIGRHSIHLGGLLIMALAFGVADAFFNPASSAILPELLPEDLLVRGNALSSSSQMMAQMLIGPALGGIIVAAVGSAWSFGLDAASFGISAVCLLCMHPVPAPIRPTGVRPSALSDVREGLRYCRSQPWLWVTILAAGLANFAAFSPSGVLIPLLVRHVLHQGPLALGFVLAAGGASAIAVTLLVGHRGMPARPITPMWIGWGLAGVAIGLAGLAPDVWILGPVYAVATALLMFGNALWNPLMQQRVPRHLLGRASSVDWMLSLGLSPLGIVVAGALAGVIGTRTTMFAGGLLSAGAALCLLVPGVRDPKAAPVNPETTTDR
jgi:MFS family permease